MYYLMCESIRVKEKGKRKEKISMLKIFYIGISYIKTLITYRL